MPWLGTNQRQAYQQGNLAYSIVNKQVRHALPITLIISRFDCVMQDSLAKKSPAVRQGKITFSRDFLKQCITTKIDSKAFILLKISISISALRISLRPIKLKTNNTAMPSVYILTLRATRAGLDFFT